MSSINSLTLDNARMILHMWETIRVWMILFSFIELKVEVVEDDDDDGSVDAFTENT
ncbi:uncharacterized protein DS421_16g528300 [Arachis hypogaea]|nr:uncharacterized protein DS421_16g528300 [Arachis hypogaea]